MSKPRVGLLHYTCPPVIGGVETILYEQAWRLRERGFPVTVIAGRGGPLPAAGIELALMPAIDSRAGTAGAAEVHRDLDPVLESCDVLIAHNALTMHFNRALTTALFAVAERARPRVVSWVHDLSWANPLYLPQLRPDGPDLLLRRYHPRICTVCVSHERLQQWLALSGAPPESARVIPNGIDPSTLLQLGPQSRDLARRFQLFDADAVLLAPTRITRRKNLEWVLDAAAALRGRGQVVRALITGPPGPHDPASTAYADELRARRARLQLEDSVVFLSDVLAPRGDAYPVDSATLKDLYMLSDVVVYPSQSEGFGLPLAESALFRIPIVHTDLPAFAEVGVEGAAVVSLDGGPSAFTAAVESTLGRPAVTSRRAVLRRLSWDRILTQDLEPLIESLQG